MKGVLFALAVVAVALVGCGPSGKQGKTTPSGPRNVEMEEEEFVVKAPQQTLALEFEDEKLLGEVYQPEGQPEAFVLTPAKPMPKAKNALDLEVRRAALAKAAGKAKVSESEWLALAITAKIAAEGETLGAEQVKALRDEAVAVLDAAVVEKTAGETTWVMLATLQYGAGLTTVSAKTWQNVIDQFPKSKLLGRYKLQRAWALFVDDPVAAATLATSVPDAAAGAYFGGWGMRRHDQQNEAVIAFQSALAANPPPALAAAIRRDLLHTLAWRGPAADKPLVDEVRALGGDAAAQVATLMEVAQYLADKGDFVAARPLLAAVQADAAATPAQVVKSYEIGAQDAMADRRIDELAAMMEKLLDTAAKFAAPGADGQRAMEVAQLVATTLHSEWGKTKEEPVAAAATRVYAAMLKNKALSTTVDVSGPARDLEEQRASKDPPPEMESNKDLVRRVVRLNFNGVRHCYERALAVDGKLAGKWQFTLTPDAPGTGSAVKTSKLDGLPEPVGQCMEEQAKKWKFPPHSKRVTITINLGLEFVQG